MTFRHDNGKPVERTGRKAKGLQRKQWQPVVEGRVFFMKKTVFTALICSVLFSMSTSVSAVVPAKWIDTAPSVNGAVGVRYAAGGQTRIKTGVQLGDNVYYYDLFGRQDYEYFPLQMGNGSYSVSVFENISDNRYRVVNRSTLDVAVTNPLLVFLNSIQTVHWTNESNAVTKAAELTAGLTTDQQKLQAIYAYITKNVSYDYEKIKTLTSSYVPDVDGVLAAGKGICYDYSALFGAMLRGQGIPAKLIKGYSTNVGEYHAWNKVWLSAEQRWITIDTTFDAVYVQAGRTVSMEKPEDQYTMSKEY